MGWIVPCVIEVRSFVGGRSLTLVWENHNSPNIMRAWLTAIRLSYIQNHLHPDLLFTSLGRGIGPVPTDIWPQSHLVGAGKRIGRGLTGGRNVVGDDYGIDRR